MSYTKHNFKKGAKLLAAQLNEMDDQIALNETAAGEKYTKPASGIPAGDLSAEVLAAIRTGGSTVTLVYDAERRAMTVTGAQFEGRIRFVADKMYTNAKAVLDAAIPNHATMTGLRMFVLTGKQKSAYVHNQTVAAIAGASDSQSFWGKIVRWRSDGSYQAALPNASYDAILEAGDTMDAADYDDTSWAAEAALGDTVVTATAAATSDNCKDAILGSAYDGSGKVVLARLIGKSALADKQAVLLLFTGGTAFSSLQNGFVVRKRGSMYEAVDPNANYDAVVEAGDQYVVTELEV